MHSTFAKLLDRLDSLTMQNTGVLEWGAPVPSFGNLATSKVATVGINPSNREFMDISGAELRGAARRFHTLESLGIERWAEVDATHLTLMLASCTDYFSANPYDAWFKRLDQILVRGDVSFYSSTACHLDLIPYATLRKWSALTSSQHMTLFAAATDVLGLLIRESPVRVIILNGKSVVNNFERAAGLTLAKIRMPAWSLPRHNSSGVAGFAYKCVTEELSGVHLGRELLVLGYNHNLQSSFGVTSSVVADIANWITTELSVYL